MSTSVTHQPGGPPGARPHEDGPVDADFALRRDGEPRSARRDSASRLARDRRRHRRRRALVLVVLLITLGLLAVDLTRDVTERARPAAAPTTPFPASTAPTANGVVGEGTPSFSPSPTPSPSVSIPVTGPGTFRYATGQGPILGTAGTLRRFRVAVEDGMGQDPNEFAAAAERILGDERSWIASRQVRFQRVPRSANADFTLYLATGGTSERMCAEGGLHTEKFTSCRLPGQVIINVERWLHAIPDYGAPLEVYQAYAINHEVGHQLGHGHEACPGPGRLAPVMQQQTYGLKGCRANAWPYVDGRRYAGPPIP